MIKIYIISLKSCIERRELMLKQFGDFNKSRFCVELFDAIDFRIDSSHNQESSKLGSKNSKIADSTIQNLTKFIKPLLNKIYWGRELSLGEIGCFGSHFSLWSKCLESNEPMIILEDDVILQENFSEAIDRILKSEFEYVRLYGIFKVETKQIYDNFYMTTENLRGTQGYYLTPNAARKFIIGLEKIGSFIMPVDDYMDSFFMHNVPNILHFPYAIKEGDLDSTISGREKQKFSIFKVTREIFRIWRKIQKIVYILKQRRYFKSLSTPQ